MPPLPFGVPTLASGLGVAFAVSLLLTPLVRMIALRVVPTDFPSQDSDSSSIDDGSPRDRGTPTYRKSLNFAVTASARKFACEVRPILSFEHIVKVDINK